jgi:hypothetical protein
MSRLAVPQSTGQNHGMIKPLGLLIATNFLFPGLVYSQAPLQNVVVTYSSRSIASIDLFVAHERGFFREESLEPQLVQVRATAAIETYRISKGAFTTDGIPSDSELSEYLKDDAQILGLPAPVPVAKVFDFTIQREVNRELGAK